MTKINDVLTSVKRGRMTIDELKTEFTESLNLLHDGLSNIEQPLNEIANFEKEQNEILEKYQSSNTALSKEVNSLQQGKEQNEQLLANTQDTLEEKTDQRIKLENEKREKSTQLENLTKNLELAKDDLQNEKQVLQQLLAEIEQMKKETEQKVLEIRSKAKQKRDHIQKVKGERMALQFLIKNKYIEFNEMKIIDSLKGRRNTDVNTIAKVTGLSPNLISQTLTGLMKRDLVNYDKDSGKIEVLSNLKI